MPIQTMLLGDLMVAIEAVQLAVELEFRGFIFSAEAGTLHVSHTDPDVKIKEILTDRDRQLIKQYKSHLLAVVSYEAPTIRA